MAGEKKFKVSLRVHDTTSDARWRRLWDWLLSPAEGAPSESVQLQPSEEGSEEQGTSAEGQQDGGHRGIP